MCYQFLPVFEGWNSLYSMPQKYDEKFGLYSDLYSQNDQPLFLLGMSSLRQLLFIVLGNACRIRFVFQCVESLRIYIGPRFSICSMRLVKTEPEYGGLYHGGNFIV